MVKSIWLNFWICSFLVLSTRVHGDTEIPITILESAIAKGAVCLDGSAPAYSYVEGYGNGFDSWIVFLQVGGWCYGQSNCYERSNTYQGSSELMDSRSTFYALLDSDCTFNPHFCNWHKVHIHYCDGSSFMSDIMDPKTTLSFRGANIFNAVIEEMLAKGMRNATHAILSGSSAGGVATMLHCDKFRELFPSASRVKCISDSGFFIHGKGLHGDKIRENYFSGIIKTHNLTDLLPPTCTSKMNPSLCLFPEYFAGDIETPLFIIESAFDQKQLTYLVLDQSSSSCTDNLINCNSTELGIIRDFRTTFIKTLMGLKKSSSRGMFVHSCYLHCVFPFSSETWLSIKLANKTIEQAVADWYFDRSTFQEIDTENDLPRNCTSSFCQKKTRVHENTEVPITLLERAVATGAVCLDGSAPAYSYIEGSGNGSDSWIVYLQGGGMCATPLECEERSNTYQGSSDLMDSQTTFYALMDSDCTFNPHFCNWHKVYIQYCDGSSFLSDVIDSKTNLYYRGARIFNVMMEEMLVKGMRNAKQAILSGSSSGAIANLIHCDKFRKLFPMGSRVKCISDSGFFPHGKGHLGDKLREEAMANIIKTHELANSLPQTCTSKMNPDLCLFPEYFVDDIQTPLFLIESAFDQNRLTNFVFDSGNSCVNNLISCNSTELGIMKDSRKTFLRTLRGLENSSSRGLFVHSCYLHTHFTSSSEIWISIALANKTIEQAIADWYFDRGSFQEIDIEHVLPRNCTHSYHHKLNAILSGNSSSGIATLLLCDKFRKLFPNTSRVKCISDSGFFFHGKGHFGDKLREETMANAIKKHVLFYTFQHRELANSLPPTCTSKMHTDLCLFPDYFIEDIQTPVFLIESTFDRGRLTYFVFGDGDNTCVNNLMSCNSTELAIIQDNAKVVIKTLMGLKKSSSRGMFVHSCYFHCALPSSSETWLSITLANKTMERAIADWYFDRSSFEEIDTTRLICTSFHEKKSPASLPLYGSMSSLFSYFPFLF